MSVPTISFLITYYNEKELLTQCLESVYQQTVLPDEIVIYDDASVHPARDYAKHHPNVPLRIIEGKKNIMLAGARNELMKAASSEYIHYQDADDLVEPFCIERLKQAIASDAEADVVINEVRSVAFADLSPISQQVMSLSTVPHHQMIAHAIGGSLLAPSTTFRKEFGLKLGGYKAGKLLQCEDFEFNIRLLFYARKYKVVSEPLIIQRIRPGSMSSNKKELYEEALKALVMLSEELPEKYQKFLAARASKIGRQQYAVNNIDTARKAFELAKKLNRFPYRNENLVYRFIAFFFGQIKAEKVAGRYRQLSKPAEEKNVTPDVLSRHIQ